MKEILEQFLDASTIEQQNHYFFNPDTEFYLFSVDGHGFDRAFFVLVETDYFEPDYMSAGIKEKFSVSSIEWVQPKQKKVISVNNGDGKYFDQIELTASQDGNIFALALISDKSIHQKSN